MRNAPLLSQLPVRPCLFTFSNPPTPSFCIIFTRLRQACGSASFRLSWTASTACSGRGYIHPHRPVHVDLRSTPSVRRCERVDCRVGVLNPPRHASACSAMRGKLPARAVQQVLFAQRMYIAHCVVLVGMYIDAEGPVVHSDHAGVSQVHCTNLAIPPFLPLSVFANIYGAAQRDRQVSRAPSICLFARMPLL